MKVSEVKVNGWLPGCLIGFTEQLGSVRGCDVPARRRVGRKKKRKEEKVRQIFQRRILISGMPALVFLAQGWNLYQSPCTCQDFHFTARYDSSTGTHFSLCFSSSRFPAAHSRVCPAVIPATARSVLLLLPRRNAAVKWNKRFLGFYAASSPSRTRSR